MARIYFAVVQDGVLVGDFARVADFDLAGDVDDLKQRIKDVRGAELAGVEPWHMTVFGPWPEQPRVAGLAHLLGKEPCRTADILDGILGDMERAYFIVRITAPPPAAAAGA